MLSLLPNLIDPIDGYLGRLSHGPMHRFTFSRDGNFTGYEAEMLMCQYGIRIWGREPDDSEELAFLVKQSQAVWAEYLLCRAGVPLTCELLDSRNAQYVQRHLANTMPKPWRETGIGPHSFIEHLSEWLDRLID